MNKQAYKQSPDELIFEQDMTKETEPKRHQRIQMMDKRKQERSDSTSEWFKTEQLKMRNEKIRKLINNEIEHL